MKTFTRNLFTLILIAFISTSINAQEKDKKKKKSPTEQRAEIDKMTSKALAELYKVQPQARNEIANAKGYAVFSNFGMNLLLLS